MEGPALGEQRKTGLVRQGPRESPRREGLDIARACPREADPAMRKRTRQGRALRPRPIPRMHDIGPRSRRLGRDRLGVRACQDLLGCADHGDT